MSTPVVAIGLDAADPLLLEQWIAAGHLPNIRRLRQSGGYGRLGNLDYYKAETPWTTFLTGCLPQRLGYWTPVKLQPGSYTVEEIEAYPFDRAPPFYALGEDYRVAVFDVPQTTLSDDVNGPQVLAWGAHSPQTPSHSRPEPLFRELNERFGEHPALHRDHGDWWNVRYLKRLQESLNTGIERRIAICRDFLQQERWDLFLTIFGEPHSAGHDFWYLSQPDHPLYRQSVLADAFPEDPLLDVFRNVDRAVGEIVKAAPPDAFTLVFSVHGSGNNVTDLASMALLPEFLYRYSFPGRRMLGHGRSGTPVPPIITAPREGSWTHAVWAHRYPPNALHRTLRPHLPRRLHGHLDRWLPGTDGHDLVSTAELQRRGTGLSWQPATWYCDLWPQMKAFALPSFSEGYVRINLQGRDPSGRVAPGDYDAVCEELTRELQRLVNPRTGKPVVKKVVRTRASVTDEHPDLPDADLVVLWDEEPADVVDHPVYDRIGPLPYRRTGSHRERGFWLLNGPGVEPGSQLPTGHAADLGPTILSLMGAPAQPGLDGRALLALHNGSRPG